MTTFTFNSRESYLQYRALWKTRYAALSGVIRDLKFARKGPIKIGMLGQMERYEQIRKAHASAYGFFPACLALINAKEATAMLEELKLAKAEAQRQYEAAHAVLAK